ncbi:MAG: type VI secretion system baseplate subunit TssE [Acetobacteraceae bacterium]|nr:type VI secretion system baseplate subunit TssE [Acetobacteraceae bacterium]
MSGRPRRGGEAAQIPLLDRLIDNEPERATDRALSPTETLAILMNSVRRDLEMLLNARRRFRSWPSALRELDTSPLNFGIPDCTAGTFNDQREREAFRAEVEATIRRFEPRFLRVSVQLPDADPRKLSANLNLRIEALMHADPAPEAISFETMVDATTSNITIQAVHQG